MSGTPGHLVERAVAGFGGLSGLTRSKRVAIAPGASAAPVAHAPEAAAVSLEALMRAGMMPWGRRRNLLTDEFRIAQSALLRALDAVEARPGRNLVMVTSARPGEGKSFVALNLAAGMAHYATRPVLLVDTDAKDRPISYHLGLSDRPGILEVAAGAVAPDVAILATEIPGLSVIPIGGGTDRGAASAEHPLERAVERLGQALPETLVVLDLPPCLSRSESSAFAPLVGHTLMVVEAQNTQRSEVEAALDLVEACPSIALLLNKVRRSRRDAFGSYGDYS